MGAIGPLPSWQLMPTLVHTARYVLPGDSSYTSDAFRSLLVRETYRLVELSRRPADVLHW